MKNLPTNEGDGEENRKIIKCRYRRWKNLPTWTKDREGKTEIGGEKGNVVWSMRNLDNKGLGQNSDSSLSPLSCRLFLVASLGAFLSMSCWSPSLLFGRKLACWSSHWWRGIDGRRSRCWLVKMVLMKRANELSKVLNRWDWLSGILFLRISLPWNQIVETW